MIGWCDKDNLKKMYAICYDEMISSNDVYIMIYYDDIDRWW